MHQTLRFIARLCPQPDRPRPTKLLPTRSNGKPEATTAVDKLLMMGKKMSEICLAVFKRRAMNLKNCCIWLVDLFGYGTESLTQTVGNKLSLHAAQNSIRQQFSGYTSYKITGLL
jgi:hypothetical protein